MIKDILNALGVKQRPIEQEPYDTHEIYPAHDRNIDALKLYINNKADEGDVYIVDSNEIKDKILKPMGHSKTFVLIQYQVISRDAVE